MTTSRLSNFLAQPSNFLTTANVATVAVTGSYSDLLNKPAIPSITGLASETFVNTQINSLINGAPGTLDTLKEIADQLALDENSIASIMTTLATKANTSSLSTIATTGSYTDLVNKPVLGTAAATNITQYATAAQGTKADTAVQPSNLATVATSGNYADLINKPLLGTAASTNSTAYATAAQGTKADTAVQPASLATVATSGSYTDLLNKPVIPSITGLASETFVTTQINNLINGAPATLDTLKEIADQLASDQSAVAAITTTLATKANTSSLATVATSGSYTDLLNKPTLFSGSYTDLTNKPTLGTAAATNSTAYATAAQGTKADTAVQPSSLASVATSGSYTDLINKPVLGTAAATNVTAYATALQGSKADTAVQPGSLATVATSGNYNDLINKPTSGGITYVVKTADYTAKDKEGILADTTNNFLTISLPANPTAGMQVFIADKGNWAVNPLTISANGSTIDGVNTSRAISTGDVSIQCLYDGTTWKLFTFPNIVDISPGTISDIFVRNTFVSYFPQTTIKTVYTPGQLEVYINGVLIPRAEYTATNGSSIVFNTAIPAEAIVDVKKYSNFSLFNRTTFTSYANQTVFSVAYIPGLLEVVVNGVMVTTSDYLASSGTNVIFNQPLPAGSVVEFKAYAGGSTFSTNIFTAYGGQTDLQVQHVKELTEVYLNGILARPEWDYTHGSNIIYFSSPLPSGTLVYIKKFSKLPYGELDWTNITNKPSLFSGSYTDLTNKPVTFSGSYTDLTNKPVLFSGSYVDLTNKPTYSTVATTGSYNDLLNKPTIPSIAGLASELYVSTQINSLINGAPGTLDTLKEIADQLALDESAVAAITTVLTTKANASSLSTVATTGSYTDLVNKPAAITPATISDQINTSTGAFSIPSGTTAQRPLAPAIGYTRFNTDTLAMENYTGTAWLKISVATPVISSISGSVIKATAGNLTLSGINFLLSNLVVNFTVSGTTTSVTVTPTSQVSAIVAIPSAVYNAAIGASVSITVTNSDGAVSAAVTTPVLARTCTLTSISGDIVATATSTLTLTGTGFLSTTVTVNFAWSGGSGTATATASSDTNVSVIVPSTVYSAVSVGTAVNISVTNADGSTSSTITTNAVSAAVTVGISPAYNGSSTYNLTTASFTVAGPTTAGATCTEYTLTNTSGATKTIYFAVYGAKGGGGSSGNGGVAKGGISLANGATVKLMAASATPNYSGGGAAAVYSSSNIALPYLVGGGGGGSSGSGASGGYGGGTNGAAGGSYSSANGGGGGTQTAGGAGGTADRGNGIVGTFRNGGNGADSANSSPAGQGWGVGGEGRFRSGDGWQGGGGGGYYGGGGGGATSNGAGGGGGSGFFGNGVISGSTSSDINTATTGGYIVISKDPL